ncbi:uncharacterized protein LOC100830304 [Brachypodium distachyon]|uniref:Transcription factor CBF/NF-Y/archaeal histone domain-containing protein n=1 Tax=Brachypodium distachyon TaxID=15368 RepID=I1HCQ7_BRADI|nr:uncharacterized protein LOC100830304 [Brachypodium distachyon]XP_014753807.1 uncharacterized protein LOC100830304 [Brachypodium distachyon]KQK03061.1 hypothetical protein BRADI_2g05280v3 [Brachypodium distachyon]|eukprot:XP_003565438.1 uncharacterized protein LOC100830304 [Brachypodium distachyon]
MATVDAVAEPTEAMEVVQGEEQAAEVAAEPTKAMEQVEGEEGAAEAAAESNEAMEQVEEEERVEVEAGDPADEEEDAAEAMEQVEEEERAEAEEVGVLSTVLPLSRVKKIIRVDREIRKVTAEASLLIAAATELFLGSLAAGAHAAAAQRGRRAVRAAHIRAAARAHRPTADFLLDCLPAAEEAPRARSGSDGGAAAAAAAPKPLPRGTRRIDGFFQKVT